MLLTDGRHSGLKLAKAFLALLSLLFMSFCTLPRYVKLSTNSSVRP